MPETSRRRFLSIHRIRLTSLLGYLCVLINSAPSQSPPEARAAAMIRAAISFDRAFSEESRTPTNASAALGDFLQAVSEWTSAVDAVRGVAELLEGAPENWPKDLDTERLDELIRRCATESASSGIATTIPALLVLNELTPTDARVQYLLAEAYGLGGPLFDAHRAMQYVQGFQRIVYSAENELDGPSILALGLMLGAGVDELRGRRWVPTWLHRSRSLLISGDPIRRVRPVDLACMHQLDILRDSRLRGAQDSSLAALDRLIELDPDNPAYYLMQGQALASVGRSRNLSKARVCLGKFEKLVDSGPGDPERWRECELAAILDYLGFHWPEHGLLKVKEDAHALLIRARLTPPLKALFFADFEHLREHTQSLQWDLNGEKNRRALLSQETELKAKVAEREQAFRNAQSEFERARRNPGPNSINVSRAATTMQDRKEELTHRRKQLAKLQEDIADHRQALDQAQHLLEQISAHRAR